ncbi:MAG TPA: carbohydrate binding family 9 domain-containing protein [Gemmatimonadaceae bacterium]|nr:carbohydrate binding family 9 domain-containing protein [Gemmatimonadaceae bacterium]
MLLPFLAAFQLGLGVPPRVYNGRAGDTQVAAPRIDADVVIDGRLDEPAWSRAALLTGFSLYQPVDQRPSPDSTDVLVWYSSDAIYFGIRAYAQPGTVAATLADRDRVSSDDNVEIHLDTFRELNRAFVFIVNPLGIQADGTKNEAGGFIPGSNVAPGQNDLSADLVWQSRGRVTDWGYEVEVRIPFSSLRYPARAVESWGLQIDRHVQRNGYEETWTAARRGSASFVAQEGMLTGLAGMHHGQIVEVNPELTNTTNGLPCCDPAFTQWRYSSNPQFGGNIRWTLGSNVVLNGTVKPDFSQVEADATQIAADERFALFYPEKRPFFVEALDQFNVPNTLVYTRSIVQPEGAAKVTGKVGQADVAVLSAVDQPQLGASDHPLVDIVRLKQSFWGQSQAGMLYSDRVGADRANRLFGGDTHIVFGDIYFAQFQAVESMTSDHGIARSGPMWEAVLDATGRKWGFHYNVIGIHPDFQADNGFVPRVGFVQPNAANRFTWYGKPGAFVERFNIFLTENALWGYKDFFNTKSLLEDHASAQLSVNVRGGWSIGASPKVSSYAFSPGDYAQLVNFVPSDRIESLVSGFTVATPQFRRWAASVGTTMGGDVDFLETSRVERRDYNASLDLRPNERLRIGATYVSSAFTRRSDGEVSATTRIPRIKLEYQLARPIFVRVVSQYTATRREPLVDPRTGEIIVLANNGSPTPSTASASNSLRTDWLFSYRPAPGTVFFLGYGGSMSEADPLAFNGLRRTADSFFVKGSYVFRTTVP